MLWTKKKNKILKNKREINIYVAFYLNKTKNKPDKEAEKKKKFSGSTIIVIYFYKFTFNFNEKAVLNAHFMSNSAFYVGILKNI